MTTHTIDLSGDYIIGKGPKDKSWLGTVTVKLADIPASIVLDLVKHGLKQKIADRASNAKTPGEAEGLMQSALDSVLKGEWRATSSGVDGTRTMAIMRLFKAMLVDRETLARFNKLDAAVQIAKAEANVTDETAIAAEVAVIEADRKAKADAELARKAQVAELAKSIKIDF